MMLFPVTYSALSEQALAEHVQLHYAIGRVSRCRLLSRGLNDTYLVVAEHNKYILRVYRTPWRRFSDIMYELDVLTFLGERGFSSNISTPILSKQDELAIGVCAPEGTRYITLFTFADGSRAKLTPTVSSEYGRMLAQVHHETDFFKSSHARFELNLGHLLDEPFRAFQQPMLEYNADVAYVESWISWLKQHLDVAHLDVGFCHGDPHDWNAHWSDVHGLTLFDFDCCGRGYRCYDLAVFLWNLQVNYKNDVDENWAAYLDGYTAIRPLDETDLHHIPLFVVARRIWLAGMYAVNHDLFGLDTVNEHFFEAFIRELREDERTLGISLST